MLQNDGGHYSRMAHTLKFEGSMFMYDPQRNIAQWVPVRGVSASLTMVELRSANDLNNMIPSPYEGTEPVQPPSPTLVKGIPVGWNLTWIASKRTPEKSGTKRNTAIGHALPLHC